MLSKTENKIMLALCNECKDKSTILITPADLIKISGVEALSQTKLELIVKDLCADGYFDLIYSDRHGETVYCVTIKEKGKGYTRGLKVMKRNLIFRLVLTISFALLSFVVGLILKAIF